MVLSSFSPGPAARGGVAPVKPTALGRPRPLAAGVDPRSAGGSRTPHHLGRELVLRAAASGTTPT